jgi:hypothetical protein
MASAAAIGQLLGQLIPSIGGGISQSHMNDWLKAMSVNQLNAANQWTGYGLDRTNEAYGPLADWAKSQLGPYNDYMNNANMFMGDQGQQMFGQYANAPWSQQGMAQSPYFDQTTQALQGYGQAAQPGMQLGQQLMSGQNPWSGQSQQAQGVMQDILMGRSGFQGAAMDQSERMVNNGGETGLNRGVVDRMNDANAMGGYSGRLGQGADIAASLASAGGMTPGLQNMIGTGQGLIGMGTDSTYGSTGQTAAGQQAQQIGLQTLLGQGNNAATDYLSGRGQELSGKDPLLSMKDLLSFTQDQSARQRLQQAEAMQRQAQKRGGGPGTISGQSNAAMSEFMDAALGAEADARQKAITGQQGLGLQQLAQGLSAVGQGGGLAADREKAAQNLFLTPEQLALQRMGVGINAGSNLMQGGESLASGNLQNSLGQINNYQNTANNYMGQTTDAAFKGSADQLSRMGMGNTLGNSYLQSLMGGAQNAQNLWNFDLGTMGQGNAMNLANAGFGAGLQNNIYGNYNADQAQNLARNAASYTGANTAMGWNNNAANNMWNQVNAGQNALGNMGGNWLGQFAGPAMSGYLRVGQPQYQNPWSQLGANTQQP